MAKIIHEFDSVEDREDWEIFAQALKMHAVLCDLRDELRSCVKHTDCTDRDQYWRDRLFEILEERRVELGT
jgi:hypothetical protein